MPITRVQGNARGTSTTDSIAASLASAPTQGNLLIAAIAVRPDGSSCSVSGITQTGVTWTRQAFYYSTNLYVGGVEIWAGVVGSGASPSVTVNISSGFFYANVVDICEYSGLLTSDFLDTTDTNYSNGSQTADTGTTQPTAQSNELFVGAIAAVNTGQSTPTNGFALLDGVAYGGLGTSVSLAYLEKIVSTTEEANSGTTCGASTFWEGCIATFKEAVVEFDNIVVNNSLATNDLTVVDMATVNKLEADRATVDTVLTLKAPDMQNYIDIKSITGQAGPVLQSSQAILAQNDIMAYGVLACSSDPAKTTGSGAIRIGHGYQETPADEPKIILTDTIGGGSGATATLTVNTSIKEAAVTDGGEDYTYAVVTVNSATGSGADLSACIVDNKIDKISVTNGGQNYLSSDTITITGNGRGAKATLTTGNITSVNIGNQGNNYTFADVAVTTPGSGAELKANIGVNGQIDSITVTNGGSNYRLNDVVKIRGDGQGATATLTINPSGGGLYLTHLCLIMDKAILLPKLALILPVLVQDLLQS